MVPKIDDLINKKSLKINKLAASLGECCQFSDQMTGRVEG